MVNIDKLYRFENNCTEGGWLFTKTLKDNRTTKEILQLIDGIAEKHPSLKEFTKDLKAMNPKHLNLAADTMELATKHPLVTDRMHIHLDKVYCANGKTLVQYLLGAFPKASKENPHALEFMQEVIDNTDRKTIEYVLADLPGVLDKPHLGEHLKALKPMIKEIAEQTIGDGFPRADFEKQEKFMQFVKALVNTRNNPKKIELLPKLSDAVDKCPAHVTFPVTLDKFTESKTPIEQVVENIEILPQVAENGVKQGKIIDVVDFVNNNVNLY